MKALILASFLFSPLAQANDGLIQVPADAIVTSPTAPTPRGSFFDLAFAEAGTPTSDNADDYVRWLNDRVLSLKKSAMATRAASLRPSREVGCLPFHDAFGFEQINETEYKLNCFAGNKRNISHVLDYHLRVTFTPTNCATEQAVRDFFAIPVNRNPRAATAFLQSMKSSCVITAAPVDTANPIVRNVGVSPTFVQKALEKKDDLRLYVNGSREQKRPSSQSGPFTNPLRSGSRPAN